MSLKHIQEIKEWMIHNRSYPELIEWVPKYLWEWKNWWTWVTCHNQ